LLLCHAVGGGRKNAALDHQGVSSIGRASLRVMTS
jgi:hypothetical protein